MGLFRFKRNSIHPDTNTKGRDAVWHSIRSSGLSTALRVQFWSFLLTQAEKHVQLLPQSELLAIAQDEAFAHATYAAKGGTEAWQLTVGRIARDADRISHEAAVLRGEARALGIARLNRLLVAYALHDCPVGYCQGMADLAVPFLELYADDAQAFAVFRAFMARVRRNFLPGMRDIQRQMRLLGNALHRVDNQLHRHLEAVGAGSYVFAFQMLLLQLRREVSLTDTFTLWERMWASEELLAAARREQRQLQHQRQRRGRSALRSLRWRPSSSAGEAPSQQRGAMGAATGPPPPPSGGGAASPERGSQQVQGEAQAPAGDVPEAPAAEADGDTERVDLCAYVVAAALRAQRRALLGCHSMEEVVQFVNRFPPPDDVVTLVRDAERIYRVCEGGDGAAAVGPLRILSGCWRPQQRPLPVTSGGSQAWATPPCEAVA